MDIVKLSDAEFNALRDIMYEASGVRLLPTKKALVMGRLRWRLKELGINSFKDYLNLIDKPDSRELEIFINAITTNETFFYRHPEHFLFLAKKALPSFLEREKMFERPELKVWSAACATGEEPYSIAIACKEFFKSRPTWKVIIYASDINSSVLEFWRKAVYSERSVSIMPEYLKKMYFDRIEPDAPYKKPEFQLHQDIVQTVRFLHHNLLKPFPYKDFDIIFLRNAMIYFDRVSKQKVVNLVENNLIRGGYLLTSLAESLYDVRTNLQYIQAGVYQKND